MKIIVEMTQEEYELFKEFKEDEIKKARMAAIHQTILENYEKEDEKYDVLLNLDKYDQMPEEDKLELNKIIKDCAKDVEKADKERISLNPFKKKEELKEVELKSNNSTNPYKN